MSTTTTNTPQVKLPNKLSDLMFVAIKDLVKMENSPGYIIEMGAWHEPIDPDLFEDMYGRKIDKKACAVCFAGSVIASSLKANKNTELSPDDFDRDTRGKLDALNHIREGELVLALTSMGMDEDTAMAYETILGGNFYLEVASYDENKEQFKDDMINLAGLLSTVGL